MAASAMASAASAAVPAAVAAAMAAASAVWFNTMLYNRFSDENILLIYEMFHSAV